MDWAAAIWLSTISSMPISARATQLLRFWSEVRAAVMMWTLTSSLMPLMPTGSLMPSWSSTMNSWGMMWMMSRSGGMGMALDWSTTRRTSSRVISRFLPETATTPRLLKLLMWAPEMPKKAESISTPAMSSASSRARLMAVVVASRSTTTPLRRPCESAVPMPMISILRSSVTSAMMATTLRVPMSKPTM